MITDQFSCVCVAVMLLYAYFFFVLILKTQCQNRNVCGVKAVHFMLLFRDEVWPHCWQAGRRIPELLSLAISSVSRKQKHKGYSQVKLVFKYVCDYYNLVGPRILLDPAV